MTLADVPFPYRIHLRHTHPLNARDCILSLERDAEGLFTVTAQTGILLRERRTWTPFSTGNDRHPPVTLMAHARWAPAAARFDIAINDRFRLDYRPVPSPIRDSDTADVRLFSTGMSFRSAVQTLIRLAPICALDVLRVAADDQWAALEPEDLTPLCTSPGAVVRAEAILLAARFGTPPAPDAPARLR